MTNTWKSLILTGALLAAIVPANAGVRFFVGPVYRPYWGYPPPYYGRVYSVAPQHAHSGQLKLDTRDKNAQVYLDGAYAGKVRDVNAAWLPEGNHELEVRGTNGAVFEEQIHVLAGRTLDVVPNPDSGKLIVMSMPILLASLLLLPLLPQTRQDAPSLWVRLQTPVTSQGTAAAPIEAAVINNRGITLSGTAQPLGREKLRLTFHSIRIAGEEHPVQARVVTIDNARERILPNGDIVAVPPLRKRPGKVELLLLAAAHAHPATLAFIEGTKLTLREVDRPSVHYAAGTDLALAIDSPLPQPLVQPAPTAPFTPLANLLRTLPQRAETHDGRLPADWINVAFLGTRENLDAAFTKAGWTSAQQLSLSADLKVFFSLAAHHAYQHAPVSRLTIDGRPPDLVYQRQTNTFAKRHHIRIWATNRTWQGQPIWIAAATHDINIDFSYAAHTFIHRIDSNIDAERQKIHDDLAFAEAIREAHLLPRPNIPSQSRNATGDPVQTDGALLILKI